jgi:hypothetical protein
MLGDAHGAAAHKMREELAFPASAAASACFLNKNSLSAQNIPYWFGPRILTISL